MKPADDPTPAPLTREGLPPGGAEMRNGGHRDVGQVLDRQLTGLAGAIPPGRLVVVASRYHERACDSMVAAAVEAMLQAGVPGERITVARVPGAWELPLAVQALVQQAEVLAAVAIGVVIRGETTHDEHINRAVSLELMQLGTEYRKPIGLGLLTCNTPEQVAARTGGELGNKGTEAAEAVLEMLRLLAQAADGAAGKKLPLPPR